MRKFKSFENRACVEWGVDYSHVLERKKKENVKKTLHKNSNMK